MAEKLYFESSDAANLDAMALDADPSAARPDHVKSNHLYKNMTSREIGVGTMPVISPESIKIDLDTGEGSNCVYNIPEGYHDGTGKVYTGSLKDYTKGTATPEEVINNKVFWVNGERKVGTLNIEQAQQIADAKSEDIVDGKTAWVNGEKVTGNIPRLPRVDKTLLCEESYTLPYGLSAGTSIITAASLASQTPGDVDEADVVNGKTAWSNGKKIIGTFNPVENMKKYLSDTDALQSHVLAGKKFYSSEYDEIVEGRVVDHTGEPIRIIDVGKEFAIPKGYYDGFSKIRTKSLDDITVASARADTILNGRTAWVNGEKITGTMPLIESKTQELKPGTVYTIPEGYHTGTGTLTTKSAVEQTDGTAVGDDLVENKTAWVNGKKIIGTMPINNPTDTELLIGESMYIPRGHHTGTGSIFTKPLSEYTKATAKAEHILTGKTAWVDGFKVVGSIVKNSAENIQLGAGEMYKVPLGYHGEQSTIVAAPLTDQTPGDADTTDIIKGKTVWVNGEKVTGTLELIGSAYPADVISGKTFYNKDAKQIQTGMLEFDGTATEEDVIEGSTFYTTNPKRKLSGSLKLSGSATVDKVLSGSTFYSTDPKNVQNGTMPNIGSIIMTLGSNEVFNIPAGYHDGNGKISVEKLDIQTPGTATPGDIVKGATAWVNGEKITGNITFDATATADKVVAGYTFYSNDAKQKITGTMSSVASKLITLNCGEEYVIVPGYYDGTSKVISNSLESQTIADAQSGDLLKSKSMWVNGQKVIGSMPNNYGWSQAEVEAGGSVTIPTGYHNGTGTITAKDLASQTVSDAIDANILDTKTAWVNGQKVTGSMPNNTGWSQDAVVCGTTIEIPLGFHDGNTTISTATLESQTPGTAVEGDVLATKTAWVGGKKITGSIPTQKTKMIRISAGNDVVIPAGFYPEGITIYSLYTDRLDLTGTDAYVKDNVLYPMSTGYIDGNQLVVTTTPIQ